MATKNRQADKHSDAPENNQAVNQATVQGYALAPFWKRALAFIMDLLVINLIVFWPFEGMITKHFTSPAGGMLTAASIAAQLSPQLYFAILVISLLSVLYFAFCE